MPEAKIGWSKDQQKAIDTKGENLIVAAAAGSGKTAVLVERIIQEVLHGDCDVDKLLVVTFTDAAAREMRQRVEASLEQALDADENKDKPDRIKDIERQIVLLSGASISTMHRFCLRILQRHFEAVDLDPEFRIGNEQELNILREDAMEQLLADEYEKGAPAFLALTDHYGTDRDDTRVHELIENAYDFSLSQPFPDVWLTEAAAHFDIADGARLADTWWYETVHEAIARELATYPPLVAPLVEEAREAGSKTYLPCLEEDAGIIEHIKRAFDGGDWDAFVQALAGAKFPKLSRDTALDKEQCARIQSQRAMYKDGIQSLQARYMATEAELLGGLRAAAPDAHELARLTIAFGTAFRAAKKERGVVDFADLEHFALDVLIDQDVREKTGHIVPSAVARALQERYHEVMVDEYQDTNGVQELIFSLVRKDAPPNLFVVGDVKQSIYRFRLVDAQMFLEKYRDYPTTDGCDRVILSQNFRSRPEVLAAVNYIFQQVMSGGPMELAYGKNEALNPPETSGYGATDAPTLAGPEELVILSEDGEPAEGGAADAAGKTADAPSAENAPATEDAADDAAASKEERSPLACEAQYIAQRIRAFLDAGTRVWNKHTKTYEPITYRDIVILMRSVSDGKAETVRKVLQQNGIPAYASSDASYFETSEVSLMLALLNILDNARQDVYLAAVLLSPIGGFTLEELAAVRIAAPDDDIFGALLTAARTENDIDPRVQQKAEVFRARLTDWRDSARTLGVPELIWQLYRDTGYYDYVGGLPGGLQKQANLRMLADRAAAYEQTNFRGLFRFLRFVKRMQDADTDLAAARTLGESENVVRIMTIHKSKGLEFPLVFVARMGAAFNLQDASATLPLHKKLGFGMYAADDAHIARYPTFARYAVAAQITQESKAEELRLLYVALTRARERLILVGTLKTAKSLETALRKCSRHLERTAAQLPEELPLAANSYLEWMLMALLHHPAARDLRAQLGLPLALPEFTCAFEKDDAHEKTADGKALAEPPEDNRLVEAAADAPWRIAVIAQDSLIEPQTASDEQDAILAAVEAREPLPASAQKDAALRLLDWHYASHGIENVPSKLSVSELKRRFAAQEAEDEGTPLFLAKEPELWRRPRFIQESGERTGAEYGSLMHSALQHMDLAGDLTQAGIRRQLDAMVAKEIFTSDEAATLSVKRLAAFYASPIGTRVRRAAKVWRELPFSRLIPIPAELYPASAKPGGAGAPGETLLIQGVIDLLFEEADGTLVLVDYKTDSNTSSAKLHDRYDKQIAFYTAAVEQILGRHVDERMLYLLHDGTTLAM